MTGSLVWYTVFLLVTLIACVIACAVCIALSFHNPNPSFKSSEEMLASHLSQQSSKLLEEKLSYPVYKVDGLNGARCDRLRRHAAVLRKVYEDGCETALVVEEGASMDLVPFWPKPLSQLVDRGKDRDWQVVMLHHTDPNLVRSFERDGDKSDDSFDGLFVERSEGKDRTKYCSMLAYIVRRNACRKMIEALDAGSASSKDPFEGLRTYVSRRPLFHRVKNERGGKGSYGEKGDRETLSSWLRTDARFEVAGETSPRSVVQERQRIPRLIFQTNENKKVTFGMKKAIDSWIDLNPEYTHCYYTASERERFVEEHFGDRVVKAYRDLVPGAYKADLWRYCVLFVRGGVYADTSLVCYVPLREVVGQDDYFVSCDDSTTGGIFNGFIACTPRNRIVGKTIENCVTRIERREYGDGRDFNGPVYPTGPYALGDALNGLLGRKRGSRFFSGHTELRLADVASKPPLDPVLLKTSLAPCGNDKPVEKVKLYTRRQYSVRAVWESEVVPGRNRLLFDTYPTYEEDRKINNRGRLHYTALWHLRKIYQSP